MSINHLLDPSQRGDALFNVRPDEVNLCVGAPGSELLKGIQVLKTTLHVSAFFLIHLVEAQRCMKEAAEHRLSDEDLYNTFQYGPVAGDKRFRQSLAEVTCFTLLCCRFESSPSLVSDEAVWFPSQQRQSGRYLWGHFWSQSSFYSFW